MPMLSKKLGQLKQWTGEKLGSLEKTEPPPDYKKLETETECRKESISGVHEALQSYLKGMDKAQPLLKLGQMLINQGKLKQQDSDDENESRNMLKLGAEMESIGYLQQDFVSKCRGSIVSELDNMLEGIKNWDQLRKKLENRRLDFDAKQNKLSKKDNPKSELVGEVQVAKLKYEESMKEAERVMLALKEQEGHLHEAIFIFAKDHAQYLRQAADIASIATDTSIKGDAEGTKVGKSAPISALPTTSFLNSVPEMVITQTTTPTNATSNLIGSLGIIQVRVVHDFEAGSSDELSLRRGDIVTVMKKIDEQGWWIGTLRGATGMFPSNYVEPFDPSNTQNEAKESTSIIVGDDQSSNNVVKQPGFSYLPQLQPGMTLASLKKANSNQQTAQSNSIDIINSEAPVSHAPCSECGCQDFSPNVFKPRSCNNCFHQH